MRVYSARFGVFSFLYIRNSKNKKAGPLSWSLLFQVSSSPRIQSSFGSSPSGAGSRLAHRVHQVPSSACSQVFRCQQVQQSLSGCSSRLFLPGFPLNMFFPPFYAFFLSFSFFRYHSGSVLSTRSGVSMASSCSPFRFTFRTYPGVYFFFLAISVVLISLM